MAVELVGREDELRRAELFLASARKGTRALVIEGEAGVGKTSVWDAGVERARAAGLEVLVARPVETETSFAFAGLGDALGERLALLERLPTRQRHALEAALMLGGKDGGPTDRHAVSLGTLGLVRLIAAEGPLLVGIDDVQWLDPASATAFAFTARRLESLPVALLVTLRTGGTTATPLGLDRGLGPERFERLTLAPLSLGATQRLLGARLRLAPPRPVMRRLHELSGGNPFYALELGRALQAGRLRLEQGERLPVTLDLLVQRRLEQLPPGGRRALAAAAALAYPTLALVAEVAGEAPEAISEAESEGVLQISAGRIRFTHPLLASGAYTAADATERRELHSRAADAVDDPEERARHLALAATGPSEEIAAALEGAALRAEGRGAAAAAAELYERAEQLTPPGLRKKAHTRRVRRAWCVFESGDSRQARLLLDEAVAHVEPGPERARALIRLARVRSYDDDLRASEALLRQAIGEAGDDRGLRGEAREGISNVLFRLRERLTDAVDQAKGAMRDAEAVGNEALGLDALGTLLLAEAALGRPHARKSLALATELDSSSDRLRVLSRPLNSVAVVWLWLDEVDRAHAAFGEMLRQARTIGDEGSMPYLLVLQAQVECVRGDFDSAARLGDEGYGLAEVGGQETVGAYLLALRALADAMAGRVESARETGQRALATALRTNGRPAEHFATAALGLAELSVGRPERAAEWLGPVVAFVRAQDIREPGTARFVPDHLEALIELGRTGEAEELLEWYGGNAVRLQRASALAIAARGRGLLAAASGELDAALVHLEEAEERSSTVPIPLERGRCLLALGIAHRRAKHKRAARETLERAGEILAGIGAASWVARVNAELARVGGRAPSPGGLTPTEGRVAELVAQGLQTKQVAAALFVSAKTVEGHLTRIYAKLGVGSRTELAHHISRGGDRESPGRSPVSPTGERS
ncbi:MAG: LuxR C-terminal-related transcriptional regulator [Actinomycetota bacterium]|nr:LuxR C-terminal-related transcriptional regulator [Actinomycetota bacterium]